MADYADLLASLDGPIPCFHAVVQIDGASVPVAYNSPKLDLVATERAECAAAIRALIAERDALCDVTPEQEEADRASVLRFRDSVSAEIRGAVLAEREACATVCSLRAITVRQGAPLDVWKTAASCEAMECAAAIRGRSNG